MRAPLVTTILALAPVALHAQAGDAVARITDYNRKVNAIETSGAPLEGRTERFVPVVQASYDMPAIARLVVGPGWEKAPAAERARAIAALTRHSATSLAKSFKGPGATAFRIEPKPIERNGAKVVKVTAGSDTLFYRMAPSGKIVDVISGGVSQLALQRADLATTVAGGGLPAMVRKLGELDAAAR